jgi:hypothetical protein
VRRMGHWQELYRTVGEEGGYKKVDNRTTQFILQPSSDNGEREYFFIPPFPYPTATTDITSGHTSYCGSRNVLTSNPITALDIYHPLILSHPIPRSSTCLHTTTSHPVPRSDSSRPDLHLRTLSLGFTSRLSRSPQCLAKSSCRLRRKTSRTPPTRAQHSP